MDMRLINPLSHTQVEILRLVNVGHSNRQIADETGHHRRHDQMAPVSGFSPSFM